MCCYAVVRVDEGSELGCVEVQRIIVDQPVHSWSTIYSEIT